SAARMTSLRMLSSFGLPKLHRPRVSGSAARGARAALDDAGPAAALLDQGRSRVVGVRALAEDAIRIRPVDEHVAAGRHARDVDRLPLLRGNVVVAEARRDALADASRIGPTARAFARPARHAVQRVCLV